jgi:hypothetical protein
MDTLVDYIKKNKPVSAFKAEPYYSAEGDSLTFYFKPDRSYGERIDDFLTVYRSMSDDGLVGCQIKGLPRALELLGSFGIKICDGKLTLGMIFIACMAETTEPDAKDCYRELADKVKAARVPDEVRELLAA